MENYSPVRLLKTCIKSLENVEGGMKLPSLQEAAESGYYEMLRKLIHVFTPLATAVIVYQYLKYFLIISANQYEESAKKKCECMRKLSKQLRALAKRYGNYYFSFMPLNHGTSLPQTKSLYMAIKEVLVNSNRPATRKARSNLLFEIVKWTSRKSSSTKLASDCVDDDRDFYERLGEADPLSEEFNVQLMRCSRELIIHGVKDFEVMSTVFRVLETVMEDLSFKKD